ncbi:MAG TPA: VOC family protein [Gaiellaceae bacterium]|nr:VOC family protein [Gaiellaceae bacterium]
MYGVIPSIRVADLDEAVAFYRDKLGFDVAREAPGNVALSYGDARVMLEEAGEFYDPAYNAAIRARLASQSPHSLYIEVKDLDAYHERLRAAGVQIVDPLADRPWGQSEFTVADCGGNWLTFWEAPTAGSSSGSAA